MLIVPLSSSTASVIFPRGPMATITSSVVGLVSLTDRDVFYANSMLWSNQLITLPNSSSVINVVGKYGGSNSAYAFMASTLLHNQGFIGGVVGISPTSGSFSAYLQYFRSDFSDISGSDRTGLGNVGVISIKKIKYGEGIQPLSFTASTSAGTVFVDSLSASNEWGYVTRQSDGASAGIIFYDLGIVLIHGPSVSAVQTVSAVTSVQVSSTYRIWQLNAYCTATPEQANYSSNTNAFYNSTVTADPHDLQDPSLSAYTNGYQWGLADSSTTSSRGSVYLRDMFFNIHPYITSVGLYNDNNELLAIAKLAQPIKKTFYTPMTIRVAIDFD